MCGICGYIHLDNSKRAREDILKPMMSALVPRGPDDEGFFLKDNVALGHRRLSIIDLETGNQPMFSEDGSIAIVYNGEIYNFRSLKKILSDKGHEFKTHSDTEVIIHAYEEYGQDCLQYFNGMFAFAIWDSNKKSLFLARDRFGKKPLYYAFFDNQFIFGSELKSILKHPSARKEIDLSALSKYLAYEYVPSPYSIFKNINKLEAAHKITLKNGALKKERYWDIAFVRVRPFNLESAEAEMLKLLKESVARRLVSDVPLGVFLSGGLDSSAVVYMMSQLMDPKEIKTFSIKFKEGSFDESSDARRVADFFGTDHREETLSPRAMLEVFPKVLGLLDEPFADSSIIPTYLVSRFTRQHVKVALGGDGGDELFMGYPSFMAHKLSAYFNMLFYPFKRQLAGIDAGSHDYTARFLRGMGFPKEIRHQVWTGAFTPSEEKKLFLPDKGLDYDPLNIYNLTGDFFQAARKLNSLDRAIYIYIKTYMTDDILVKVDRASMANSLEVRAPFLDTEFANFVAGISPSFKLKSFRPKWILKDALRGKLPEETLNKPKHGFAVPVAKWLKNDLKPLLFEALDKKKITKEGIFNYSYIKGLMQDFIGSGKDAEKEIWALFMFEMWYDKWM